MDNPQSALAAAVAQLVADWTNPTIADDVAGALTCSELESLAALFSAANAPGVARRWIAAHIAASAPACQEHSTEPSAMAAPPASPPPDTEYDHAGGPPRLQTKGDVLGRPAVFTLHPGFEDSQGPELTATATVRVSLRYRVDLHFTVVFRQQPDSAWETLDIRCTKKNRLSSVKAVRPHIAPAAAAVLEAQGAALDSLFAIARERQAAYRLAEADRQRAAATDAWRRAAAAEEEFARFGICEARAAAVLNEIRSA
ncbi:hypothetical protein [Streptomyces sp. NPDC094468]|uniref:hypothetical protein n=1 Tax=Streptomyces sp. NPDC094468 TaxID=3366066 RepID=UPI00380EAF78